MFEHFDSSLDIEQIESVLCQKKEAAFDFFVMKINKALFGMESEEQIEFFIKRTESDEFERPELPKTWNEFKEGKFRNVKWLDLI